MKKFDDVKIKTKSWIPGKSYFNPKCLPVEPIKRIISQIIHNYFVD
jgi:hypothetical protein